MPQTLVAAVIGLACAISTNAAWAKFQADTKTVAVASGKVAWYERGAGPPLVMIMGSGSTMAEWDPALLRMLASGHRLILFDNPGMGRSSPVPSGATFAQMADTVAAFLGAIGVSKADVLAWSLGGFIAQQVAVRRPELVSKLILAGTNPGGRAATYGPEWASTIDSDPNATEEDALAVNFPQSRKGSQSGKEFLRRLEDAAATGEAPDDFDVPDSGFQAQVDAESIWIKSDTNFDDLSSLRMPTLVTNGGVDLLVPPKNARRIVKRVPGAELAIFPAGGHAFLFQFHRKFARTANRFLRR